MSIQASAEAIDFPILGQSSASSKPGEAALHDPATRQDFEAFGLVGSLDDLERELRNLAQYTHQFWSGIATIGEDVSEPQPPFEDRGCAIVILNIGAVIDEPNHQACVSTMI